MTAPYNPVPRYCTDPDAHGPHDEHQADADGELLRRAAARVRLRAFGAPPDSYVTDTRRTPDGTVMVFADGAPFAVATDAEPEQTAAHIVLWHPEAALAVASWLEHTAGHGEINPHALATARALTGETP